MRALLATLLLTGCLAAPLRGQQTPENPQTPREFSRAVAHTLQRYDAICGHSVRWAVAFDISRSGMGRWIEWARHVVYDLVRFVFVDGDTLVLIPFDVAVNPAGGGYPTYPITEAGKAEVQNAIGNLLQYRPNSPNGTAWVQATQAALGEAAKVRQAAPQQVAVALVISDRDSSDLLQDERARIDQVAGIAKPGQDLWPLPRDVKPIVVLHALADYRPSAPGGAAVRWIPPWEPPAGAAAPSVAPTPQAERRLPVAAWLSAAVLLAGGLWLLVSGLAARQAVAVRWGWRESDPSRQTSLDLPVGGQRVVQASAEPSPDPMTIFADGATNEVQRKAVLPSLGRLEATVDGVALIATEQYLLRADPKSGWANRLDLQRGDPAAQVEFRLAAAPWLLTREPIGLEVAAKGHDWRLRISLGSAALVLGVLILLLARPTRPIVAPPPPRPTVPSSQPTEQFCK